MNIHDRNLIKAKTFSSAMNVRIQMITRRRFMPRRSDWINFLRRTPFCFQLLHYYYLVKYTSLLVEAILSLPARSFNGYDDLPWLHYSPIKQTFASLLTSLTTKMVIDHKLLISAALDPISKFQHIFIDPFWSFPLSFTVANHPFTLFAERRDEKENTGNHYLTHRWDPVTKAWLGKRNEFISWGKSTGKRRGRTQ